ncbi:MAG: FtsW/RodA/SpoVE family cell cycle protein [Clostridia bacterium]|nr:FtsW/RodA/SpoVE family cell cycle protein [Clostridia bacterium]
MNKFRKKFGESTLATDFPTAIIAILLSLYGIIMVASAVRGADSYVTKQAFAVFLGICFMFILSNINYEYLLNTKLSIAIFICSIFLLILTLLIGFGSGNQNWISLKGLSLNVQPSEFVKIFFIITFAKHLDSVRTSINHIKNVCLLLLHAGIIIGLVMLQGDLGSALIFICIAVTMCFVQGMSIWYMLGGGVIITLASPYLWQLLKPYQQQRILVGFNPELDPLGYGYQQILSKKAIMNGGLVGTGYMESTVSPTIPYNHTDMIFSVLTEELGLLGVIVLLVLLVILVARIIKTAFMARKNIGSVICAGVAAMLIAQTIENIGMTLGLLPIIGITLPFMSYGGSSVLSIFLSLGIVMSVYRFRGKYFFEREPS